jgi:hypothetical protein
VANVRKAAEHEDVLPRSCVAGVHARLGLEDQPKGQEARCRVAGQGQEAQSVSAERLNAGGNADAR